MYVVQTSKFWFINHKSYGSMLKLDFLSSKQQFLKFGYLLLCHVTS
jgi:hypothetical protein